MSSKSASETRLRCAEAFRPAVVGDLVRNEGAAAQGQMNTRMEIYE
jgi:hypothetical protein